MRAALYARVSTQEQTEGYSIDAQRRAFQNLCKDRDWIAQLEFVEAGKSAHTDDLRKRPVFKQAMDDAVAGKYDVLIVHQIDRFARKLRVTLENFDRLAKAGIGFVSIQNQMDYSSPQGKFMLAMQGGLAELYSDNLSAETKKGWSERRAQGLYCGLLPFGAMKGEDGIPIPHPDTYKGLQHAFELAAQNKTDREIAQALNSEGYRTAGNQGNGAFSKDTVKGILQNRFYLGEISDGNGGYINAKHEPFMSAEQFESAHHLRKKRAYNKNGSVRVKARTYSLSGALRCGVCESRIGIHMGHSKPRIYCRGRSNGADCNCNTTFLEIYEAQIYWYLNTFVIPHNYQEKIIEMHRSLEQAYDDIDRKRARIENALAGIKKQHKWGHIGDDEYLSEYKNLQSELVAIPTSSINEDHLQKLASYLANVAEAWQEATQEQRNKLVHTLFDEIWVENNRVTAVKPKEQFKPFFQLSYEASQESSTLEPDPPRGRHDN